MAYQKVYKLKKLWKQMSVCTAVLVYNRQYFLILNTVTFYLTHVVKGKYMN